MTINAGKPITEIASLTTQPHLLLFTSSNNTNAFKKPGIRLLNQLAFTEDNFAGFYVTDRPLDTSQEQANSPSSSKYDKNDKQNDPTLPRTPPNQGSKVVFITPEDVRPFPKAVLRKGIANNNNRKGKSCIFTDSPGKDRIAESEIKEWFEIEEETPSESDNNFELPSSDLELPEKEEYAAQSLPKLYENEVIEEETKKQFCVMLIL
ncbi:hypothetical protein ILUMI_14095 [Ignelater luminosus]|uniref:Uncharacterized protein n=1 Tax=Ignelater luminosus TaxID=2038154 RepID=A0A8K0GB97_IGNLU|nr:hypothetical protein ILUMI_14095 [Ignelater luminosus]